MTQEEFQNEFSRLLKGETNKDVNDLINIYLGYLFKTIQAQAGTPSATKALNDSKIINQMVFTKLAHLQQLMNGIEFVAPDGSRLNNIIDPTVVAAAARTIYETVGMFSLINVGKSDDERLILNNLWSIAGLKFRQRFAKPNSSAETLGKIADEKAHIHTLTSEIENTALYISLAQADKDRIQGKICSKEYNIRFEAGEVKQVDGFQAMVDNTGTKPIILPDMYTFYSLNSHPSFVAVFQFADMFRANSPDFFELAAINIRSVFFLISIFIADYISVFPDLKHVFYSLEGIDQAMIDRLNVMARSEAHSINNI